jgi:hypothetical protein
MSGLRTNFAKFAASLLLCTLVIASMAAPLCPACSKILLPATNHATFDGAGQNGSPDCDRDGCSCCGFQVVAAPLAPSLGPTASASAPAMASVLVVMGSAFTLYRPPRS